MVRDKLKKVGFIVVVSYIFIFILNWEIIHALKHVKYFVYLRILLGHALKKKCNISIWLPVVKSLSFDNVIKSIPISPISNNSFQNYDENINKTKRMMRGLKKYDMKILTQTKICFGVTTNTH